ncbi:MAG TPA: fibronectin type III domain-containing protein [Fimbriimonadaceae bacterium]|nr:fibronectin type III domain-containing protein [Fimbriimonadaceae bacterium]
MLAAFAIASLLQVEPSIKLHQPDAAPLEDPMRPISEITRDGFTIQYYTADPCPTRIEIRQDDLPMTAFGRTAPIAWKTVEGQPPATTWHVLKVTGLQPGKRYYYRVYDPGLKPTTEESDWGAKDGYDREYAVSTEAPKGSKTIIHLPVKVLLMPNVINVISAYGERNNPAPEPPPLTPAEIKRIEDEYAISSRFVWIDSGMRLWIDFHFYVDDRWQRWGNEPDTATGLYKGLPLCRDYPGKDYADPGGGDFTILDTKNPLNDNKDPVVEAKPYSGQIEQAFVRRWNPNAKKWEFYNSGGGTLGLDDWPRGIPGRSQFLGGGDTAWLVTHEFHHDLESCGQFSLSNREDDRIVFNHYAPRGRTGPDPRDWSSNGPHGEHWDGMAYWDRQLSDCQWLRFYFGYTETVKDGDGDGIPDNDPRLPLDEKRFGSNPGKISTDGERTDMEKALLSTWVPTPLEPTWIKDGFQSPIPDPKKPDKGGPYPLYPYPPFIYPKHAVIDGNDGEWSGIPVSGHITGGAGISMVFKQAHDEAGYYGLFEIEGPWRRIDAIFDGEGQGVYSGVGVQSFQVVNLSSRTGIAAGPEVGVVDVNIRPFKAPGLKWQATKKGNVTIFEFSLPNKGIGEWYWHGGGHEIGSEINIWDDQGRGYALGEPYHVYYCRMLEAHGRAPLPPDAPAELEAGPDVTVIKPGDPKLHIDGAWNRMDDSLAYAGGDAEGAVYVDVPRTGDFDLLAVIEASSDAVVTAVAAGQKPTAATGYVGFIGGYGNTSSRIRINGQEEGDEPVAMTPGKHTVQLTRRNGQVWLLLDGKARVWAPDPASQVPIGRIAVIGGYGGKQKLYELRFHAYGSP